MKEQENYSKKVLKKIDCENVSKVLERRNSLGETEPEIVDFEFQT